MDLETILLSDVIIESIDNHPEKLERRKEMSKMNNSYLKFPTIEEKEKWIDYIKEYRKDNPKATPLGCKEDINYEEWLKDITEEHFEINLKEGRVPSSVYFLIEDDRIIGHLSIRHHINNPFLLTYGGHIGYGIRPSERRKGYATIILYKALEKCSELGIEDVLVTCKEDNIASAKTIEKNHGILKETIWNPDLNCNFKKYWISVEEGLKKR